MCRSSIKVFRSNGNIEGDDFFVMSDVDGLSPA